MAAMMGLAAHAGPKITSLSDGDRLTIEYMTTGCFHFMESDLVITDGQIHVDDMKTLALTPELAAGLETYFELLDDQPLGACTTTDSITVRLRRADGSSESWDYLDARCIFVPEDLAEASSEQGVSISYLLEEIYPS
ncbi:MAG: hypothetical protein CMK09_18935 [Ponticaulis sp.]|nr:hypothetical protein [Ponticaulis sp.]|tara:strand:+ start:158885 stop:159295 length:411 start_codon:yes stop_codon:yes gene_type:complete